jgi:hypothetical protein
MTEHPAPTDATVKYLYGLSSHCAFPDCDEPLVRSVVGLPQRVRNSTVAHIHARRSGGPRFSSQTRAFPMEARSSPESLPRPPGSVARDVRRRPPRRRPLGHAEGTGAWATWMRRTRFQRPCDPAGARVDPQPALIQGAARFRLIGPRATVSADTDRLTCEAVHLAEQLAGVSAQALRVQRGGCSSMCCRTARRSGTLGPAPLARGVGGLSRRRNTAV